MRAGPLCLGRAWSTGRSRSSSRPATTSIGPPLAASSPLAFMMLRAVAAMRSLPSTAAAPARTLSVSSTTTEPKQQMCVQSTGVPAKCIKMPPNADDSQAQRPPARHSPAPDATVALGTTKDWLPTRPSKAHCASAAPNDPGGRAAPGLHRSRAWRWRGQCGQHSRAAVAHQRTRRGAAPGAHRSRAWRRRARRTWTGCPCRSRHPARPRHAAAPGCPPARACRPPCAPAGRPHHQVQAGPATGQRAPGRV